MSEIEKEIEKTLNRGVDLSKEEHAKEAARADASTEKHGDATGKAPISEGMRHKRIQSNFYGTMLNIGINLYQILVEIASDLKEIKEDVRRKNK